MKKGNELYNEGESQVVYEVFCKRRKDFKIPKLKEGIYAISPELLGGSQREKTGLKKKQNFSPRAISFTEFSKEKDIRQIYGKYSLLSGKIKNPYAKIILDFDGVFKEHFTGKPIYALPYKIIGSGNIFGSNKEKIDMYCGETNKSLKINGINSLFVHLEDLQFLTKKEVKRIYKLCYSEKKLAIFEKCFLDFAEETKKSLYDVEPSKQHLLLKRKEKNHIRTY